MGHECYFTIEEITEFLEAIRNKNLPFWGETTQNWQNGRIVLWKEAGVKKPNERREALR